MNKLVEAIEQLLSSSTFSDRFVYTEPEAIINLEVALKEYKYQVAKYQERRFIQLKKCLHLKATSASGKRIKMIVEPGDKGRFLGFDEKCDNVMIETTDPGRLKFKLPVCEERRTWEWING